MGQKKPRDPYARELENEWADFADSVIAKDAPDVQRQEMRMAFVSGWFALAARLRGVASRARLMDDVERLHHHADAACRAEHEACKARWGKRFKPAPPADAVHQARHASWGLLSVDDGPPRHLALTLQVAGFEKPVLASFPREDVERLVENLADLRDKLKGGGG